MSEVDDKIKKIKDEFKNKIDEQNFFLMESLKNHGEKLERELTKKVDSKLKQVENVYNLVSTVKDTVDQKLSNFRFELEKDDAKITKIQQETLKRLVQISESQGRLELSSKKNFIDFQESLKKLSERMFIIERDRTRDKQVLLNRVERELKKLEKIRGFEASIVGIKSRVEGLGQIEDVKMEKLSSDIEANHVRTRRLSEGFQGLNQGLAELKGLLEKQGDELDEKMGMSVQSMADKITIEFSNKLAALGKLREEFESKLENSKKFNESRIKTEKQGLAQDIMDLKKHVESIAKDSSQVIRTVSETGTGFAKLKENVIGRVNLQSSIQEKNSTNLNQLTEEVFRLKKDLSTVFNAYSVLKERVKADKTFISNSNVNIEKIKQKMSDLNNAYTKLHAKTGSDLGFKQDFKEKLKSYSEQIDSLKQKISESKTNYSALSSRLDSRTEAQKSYRERLTNQSKQTEALKQQLFEFKARIKEAEEKMKKSKASSHSLSSKTIKQIDSRVKRIENTVSKISACRVKQEKSFKKEFIKLEAELKILKKFEDKLKTMDEKHGKKISASEARIKTLANKAGKSVEIIQKQAELLEKDRENVSLLKKTLESRVNSLVKQYSDLIVQIEKIIPENVMTKFDKKFKELKTDLDSINDKMGLVSTDFRLFEEKTLLSNKNYDQTIHNVKSLEKKVSSLKSEREIADNKSKHVLEQVKNLTKQLSALDEPLTSVETKFAEFHQSVKALMSHNYANTIQMINDGDKSVRAEIMRTFDAYKISAIKSKLQQNDSRLRRLEESKIIRPKDLQIVKTNLEAIIKEQVQDIENQLNLVNVTEQVKDLSKDLNKFKIELVNLLKKRFIPSTRTFLPLLTRRYLN